MKTESGGLIARIRSNPSMAILIFTLLCFVVAIGFIVAKLLAYSEQDQQLKGLVAELRASSYQLTALSRDATAGNQQAFGRLNNVVSRMDRTWDQLRTNDVETEAALRSELSTFSSVWMGMSENTQIIVDNEEAIILMHDVATTLNEALPHLQAEHDNIVDILLENRAPAEQVSMAQRQSWFAERIGRNVDKMLRGGHDADRAADEFNIDANRFGRVLEAMKTGDATMGITRIDHPDAVESLARISDLFGSVSGSVTSIFEKSPALFSTRQATNAILDDGPALQESLGNLLEKIDALPNLRKVNSIMLMIVGGLALFCLIVVGWQLNAATNRRLKSTAEANRIIAENNRVTVETNERNQNAILRLLDELGDLGDGDLTITASVDEAFTGAIADAINYTIGELRVLVSRINDTSVEVSAAAQDTQQTALHLAEASEHQAQEIAGASAAVNEMAVTIDQVSANAAESAGVAERSVSIASKGAEVVQNTINGMDTIREQIQETSKRIKRLGESSQEIGDIVSLINDIADQTNILALNAAIQASMAGDAGRGFAVVADEVQRLAERSATATKQIEALVKTIQNDTNEAVTSMEQTTSEVVRGARLAQDAGVALEEIESVSANLAELIQNISNAARQQASSAGHISNTMNVIQEITSQTSSGTGATASAIGNLAHMAIHLRNSVAGFKLPEEMVVRVQKADEFDFEGTDDVIQSNSDLDTTIEDEDEAMELSFDGEFDEEFDGDDDGAPKKGAHV